MVDDSLLAIIRSEFSGLRVPSSHDKVYKDECVISFDSPYSEGGLYVNLKTWLGFGVDYVIRDAKRVACTRYTRTCMCVRESSVRLCIASSELQNITCGR